MYTLIIIFVLIAAVLMCGVVLIQESKGGGLASAFSAQNSMLGVRKTTDFLEKATWTLAAIMVVLSVVSAAFVGKGSVEVAPVTNSLPAQQQIPTVGGTSVEAGGTTTTADGSDVSITQEVVPESDVPADVKGN